MSSSAASRSRRSSSSHVKRPEVGISLVGVERDLVVRGQTGSLLADPYQVVGVMGGSPASLSLK